ncbi:ketoacyl-ACP synthase III family protein [Mycobacterium sp.]|uniref:ketoacyl-ACP synthase III family protein n=1 Tax=Mycobacterium sp. TaxID=1785 RepID=UPI003D0F8190
MRLSNFFIESIGLYLPESYSTESAVVDGCLDADTREKTGWTGTAVAGDISAPDMAVIATKEALSRSRYGGKDLALILYGGSGVQGIPGWPAHHYVQREAIGGTAPAVGIEAGCNSTLLGFSLAAGYLSLLSAPKAALIAGADNWGSPEFDRYGYAAGATDRGSVLGDAASAVIVSTETGFARVESLVNASLPEFEEMFRLPGPLFPLRFDWATAADVAARTRSFIKRYPEKLPKMMCDFLCTRRDLIDNALADADIGMSDVQRVTHVFSGTSGYIEALLAPFGRPWETGMLDYGRGLGHLSVSDHPAALTHLVVTGQIGVGDRVLMVNNGAGMSLTIAVVRIESMPRWPQIVRHRTVRRIGGTWHGHHRNRAEVPQQVSFATAMDG